MAMCSGALLVALGLDGRADAGPDSKPRPAPAAKPTPAVESAPEEQPATTVSDQRGAMGESCRARSDCADELACIDQVCRDALHGKPCKASSQCGARLRCFSRVCSTSADAADGARKARASGATTDWNREYSDEDRERYAEKRRARHLMIGGSVLTGLGIAFVGVGLIGVGVIAGAGDSKDFGDPLAFIAYGPIIGGHVLILIGAPMWGVGASRLSESNRASSVPVSLGFGPGSVTFGVSF